MPKDDKKVNSDGIKNDIQPENNTQQEAAAKEQNAPANENTTPQNVNPPAQDEPGEEPGAINTGDAGKQDIINTLNQFDGNGTGDGETSHFGNGNDNNNKSDDKKSDDKKDENKRQAVKLNEHSATFRNNAIRSADSIISKARGTTLADLKERVSETAEVIGMISNKAAYNDIILEKSTNAAGADEYKYAIRSYKPSKPKAFGVRYNSTLKRKQTEYERTEDKLNAEIRDYGVDKIETEWLSEAELLDFALTVAAGYVHISEALFRPIITTRTDSTTKMPIIKEATTMKSYGEAKEMLSPCGGKPGFFVHSKWGVSQKTIDNYKSSNRKAKDLNQNVDIWLRSGTSSREYTELRNKLLYTGSAKGTSSPVGARLDGNSIVWNTIPVTVPSMKTLAEALNPVDQEAYKATAMLDPDRANKHVTFAYFGRFLAVTKNGQQHVDKEAKLASVIATDKREVFNISSTGEALNTSPLVGAENAANAQKWASKLQVKHASLKNPEDGKPIMLTAGGSGDLELKVVERVVKIKNSDIKRDVKELHTKEDILSSAKSVQVWNELNEDYLAANPYVASLMSFAELATPQDVIAKYRKAASTSHSSKSSSASIELVFVGAKAATINAEQNDWYSTIDSF